MGAKKTAYINSNMLKWAREQTPYKDSLELVALKNKKISVDDLSNWENGHDLPSLTNAKDLAKIYKVPFACFYLSEPPQNQIKSYANRRTITGHPEKEISIKLWEQIQDMLSNRENAIECYPDVETIFPSLPICDEKEEIKIIADKIRGFIGHNPPFKTKKEYNNNPFNYFRQLFEDKGILVFQIKEISMKEVRGISIYNDALPIIGVTSNDEKRAKVFTLFHEMAHLVSRNTESFCLVDFDEDNVDKEKWCDQVAAETLLPEEIFKKIIEDFLEKNTDIRSDNFLGKMADIFGISKFVVLRRLIDLNYIDKDQYWEKYNEMRNSYNEFVRNKKDNKTKMDYITLYLSRSGNLFPRIILTAYNIGNISYGEMCQALSIQSKNIDEISDKVYK